MKWGKQVFQVRHCEMGETRLSGQTLGWRQDLSDETLGNGGDKDFQVRHWGREDTDNTFRSDTADGWRQDFQVRRWEIGETRLSGQTLGMGGGKTFPIRHCELGETRLSGQTLGGAKTFRSDTGRTSQVRHLRETIKALRSDTGRIRLRSDGGRLGRQNLSGQTLGELLRCDTGRTTQVRHWENC